MNGFVIQRNDFGTPRFFSVDDYRIAWEPELQKAVRFERQQDAESIIKLLLYPVLDRFVSIRNVYC